MGRKIRRSVGKGTMTATKEKLQKRGSEGRFVTFTPAGIRVDLDRYLSSKSGKRALERIDSVSEHFQDENVEKKLKSG